MLVLNVTYKCKPGTMEEFLEMIITEGIDTASRAEDGNFRYEFFLPAAGGDDLLLMEKWRDTDAHAAHRLTPHYARLSELKADYVLDTVIERFQAED